MTTKLANIDEKEKKENDGIELGTLLKRPSSEALSASTYLQIDIGVNDFFNYFRLLRSLQGNIQKSTISIYKNEVKSVNEITEYKECLEMLKHGLVTEAYYKLQVAYEKSPSLVLDDLDFLDKYRFYVRNGMFGASNAMLDGAPESNVIAQTIKLAILAQNKKFNEYRAAAISSESKKEEKGAEQSWKKAVDCLILGSKLGDLGSFLKYSEYRIAGKHGVQQSVEEACKDLVLVFGRGNSIVKQEVSKWVDKNLLNFDSPLFKDVTLNLKKNDQSLFDEICQVAGWHRRINESDIKQRSIRPNMESKDDFYIMPR